VHAAEQPCVPVDPHEVAHGEIEPAAHVPSPEHAPETTKVHAVLQSAGRVPQLPHPAVPLVPGAQTPSPVHGPSTQRRDALQVRVSVPQFPQAAVVVEPGGHSSISQAPGTNVHVASHVSKRVCPTGQPASVRSRSPGEQVDSPVHAEPLVSHAHVVVQRAVCVPQRPQATDCVVPGAHAPSPPHVP
jgi:hypothetical protein